MAGLIDLSHTLRDGLETYPGLPAPQIRDFWSREASAEHYAPGTSFHVGEIRMVGNTGTYLDAPFHRYPGGKDLSELPLERVADLPGVVVRARGRGRRLDADLFQDLDLDGRAVLVDSGWSERWGSPSYFEGHPFLTREAALGLRDAGAILVGIDSLNIDDTADPRRSVHSILLEAGIPVVEHLTRLERLPQGPFRFFAVPVKVRGMGSFPVRAFALTAG